MSINIRYPNITANSEKEQIAQIRSYLHQLVNQLNYELPNIGSGDGTEKSTDTKSTQTYEVQGTEVSYYELRSLIVQDLQKVDAMVEDLEKSKANGEFDGADGRDGVDGKDGQDGYTPQKGLDYYTEEDRAEMLAEVIASLPVYDGGVAGIYNGEVVYE